MILEDALPFWVEFGVNQRVLLFVTGVTFATVLMAGVAPAVKASGSATSRVLKDESHT